MHVIYLKVDLMKVMFSWIRLGTVSYFCFWGIASVTFCKTMCYRMTWHDALEYTALQPGNLEIVFEHFPLVWVTQHLKMTVGPYLKLVPKSSSVENTGNLVWFLLSELCEENCMLIALEQCFPVSHSQVRFY